MSIKILVFAWMNIYTTFRNKILVTSCTFKISFPVLSFFPSLTG